MLKKQDFPTFKKGLFIALCFPFLGVWIGLFLWEKVLGYSLEYDFSGGSQKNFIFVMCMLFSVLISTYAVLFLANILFKK